MYESLITHEGEDRFILTTPERCSYFAEFVALLRSDIAGNQEPKWRLDTVNRSLVRTAILPPDSRTIEAPYRSQIVHTLSQRTGNGRTETVFAEKVLCPETRTVQMARLIVSPDMVEVTYPEGRKTTTSRLAVVDSFLSAAEHAINHTPGSVEPVTVDFAKIATLSMMTVAEMN